MAEHNKDNLENEIATQLQTILDTNRNKRIVVVGTTCTGKTTLLSQFPEAGVDMDKVIFPHLTKEENDYVCQSPWTEEIGSTMNQIAKKYVKVQPGNPVFGTIVFDCDLIINLTISDELLRERTQARKSKFEDAKNMQQQINEEIIKSGVPVINFSVG